MATTRFSTHEELQQIEYANKILREHQALVTSITNETEAVLNTYLPILRGYIEGIHQLQVQYANIVGHILQSTRELKVITANHQEISHYIQAAQKLDVTLSDELVQKIVRLTRP